MSCNGCRVLRKGCNENCILRESLEGIDSPQAQANATVFVAKFFGRAGLMSFISSVPASQRPALFQSLLFEACGRTLNPVNGAVGLLWTGNWHLCQSAVETVLRGGVIRAMPELCGRAPEPDDASEVTDLDFSGSGDLSSRRMEGCENVGRLQPGDLQLGLKAGPMARMTAGGRVNRRAQKRRATTPSMNSEESETTTMESGLTYYTLLPPPSGTKLLRLFL